MPSFLDKDLVAGEEVLYVSHKSLWSKGLPFVVSLLLFVGGLAVATAHGLAGLLIAFIGFMMVSNYYLQCRSTEVAITTRRIVSRWGIGARSTMEIRLDKTESIQVHQGLMGRLMGYGTLKISGAGNPMEDIEGIDNPMAFRHAYLEAEEMKDIKAGL